MVGGSTYLNMYQSPNMSLEVDLISQGRPTLRKVFFILLIGLRLWKFRVCHGGKRVPRCQSLGL